MLPEALDRFVEATAPAPTPVQEEMQAHADEVGFPTIGRAAGGVLATLARARGAQRVFEFGSGFGYSASWFLRGMDPGGEIVLTEIDHDELDRAETYLAGHDEDHTIHFEQGKAEEIVAGYPGPFDLVLIDHDKSRYPDAFQAIRDKLAPGAVVIADNMMRGPASYEDLLPYVEGEADAAPDDDRTAGIVSYLARVTDQRHIDTALLPVGAGIAISAVADDSSQ